MKNLVLAYRPLRGGITIYNPQVRRSGTLGIIAADAAGSLWLVSCYHVLCRADLSPFQAGEKVYQPFNTSAGLAVGELDLERADVALDCAAARLLPGVEARQEILGIGGHGPVLAPKAGMRVIKSGVASGITEGRIEAVRGSEVEIRVRDDYPDDYDVSDPRDSGAVWLETESRSPVALHRGGDVMGESIAIGSAMTDVLLALDLRLLDVGT